MAVRDLCYLSGIKGSRENVSPDSFGFIATVNRELFKFPTLYDSIFDPCDVGSGFIFTRGIEMRAKIAKITLNGDTGAGRFPLGLCQPFSVYRV